MPELRIHSLSFSFDTHRVLVQNANAHLLPGWTALVGANGCGKSTLLRLLAKELSPDRGQCTLQPSHWRCHFCPQDLARPTDGLQAFACSDDTMDARWRSLLELHNAPLKRWATLSAGERKRWQVGAALASGAEVLLLDEPANHLDAYSRGLLITSLHNFRGIGVLISHDRGLLGALCPRTLWLADGCLESYAMSYAEAREEREQRRQGRLAEHARARQEVRQTERRLVQARENQRAAARKRHGAHVDRKDHDARSMSAKNVRGWAEDRLGRQVEVLRKARDRARDNVPQWENETELGRSLFLGYVEAPMAILLRGAGRVVERGDRIHVRGNNGAGKTTLLRTLLQKSRLPPERVLWMPQELTENDVADLVRAYHELAWDVRGRLGHLLAALGVAPAVVAASTGVLSAGEARKLLLAMGLVRDSWLLVLDEPTNHLDLPSVERLECALAAYPGSLLLVCHDEQFAARCTTVRWDL